MTCARYLFTAAALLIVCADGAGAAGETDLAVYAGVNSYPDPQFDSLTLLEFPFSVNRSEFAFYLPDSSSTELHARIFAQVDLLGMDGYAVDSSRTYFSLKVASQAEADLADYRIFNKLILMARPGIYAARLTVIDAVSKARGEFFFDKIEVTPPDRQHLTIAGPVTAYRIDYVGEDSLSVNPRLAKNSFFVVHNPVSVFSESDTVAFLYAEVYNLAYAPEAPGDYVLQLTALHEDGRLYQPLGGRKRTKSGSSLVIAERFDIGDWPAGAYRIQLVINDLSTGSADTAQVALRIVSPQAIQLAAARSYLPKADPYDSLTLAQKEQVVYYMMTPEQKATMNQLTDDGKRNFLEQYWRERDEIPETEANERRWEMIERWRYVNQFFSTNEQHSDGYLTDRGRIYMVHGPWDQRDDFQAPRVGNPYEVWSYFASREGKVFVFEDWTGTSEYRLVHSNVEGEVYSSDWKQLIDQGYIDLPD